MDERESHWLRAGGVEVWQASPASAARAWAFLDASERARAERIGTQADRDRFVAGRGLVRWRLGALLEPSFELVVAPSGKPQLAEGPVRFNVAHSGDVVLCAFAWEREVGVDVEWLRERQAERVARRYFHPEEAERIVNAPAAVRTQLFTRCWTRKEALLKACGSRSLIAGLSSLRTPFQLAEGWEVYAHGARTWAVGDVVLDDVQHVAAVAVEGGELKLRRCAW